MFMVRTEIKRGWSQKQQQLAFVIFILVMLVLQFQTNTSSQHQQNSYKNSSLQVSHKEITSRNRVGSGGCSPSTKVKKFSSINYHQNGGMIIFWHIPKTGGSTLRRRYAGGWHGQRGLHKNVAGKIDMGLRYETYLRKKEKYEGKFLLSSNNTDILFWEIHGGPSLFSLNEDFVRWRSLAITQNKTFLAFTVLRDGPSAAISYFNFYCPQPICNVPQFGSNDFTNSENDFLRTVDTWSNYQSRLLFYGNYGQYNATEWPRRNISEAQAQTLYQTLAKLDWVGTTEMLSNNTIPILDYIATGNVNYQSTIQNEKVAALLPRNSIHESNLSAVARDILNEKSTLDHMMWKHAINDFYWHKQDPSVVQKCG